MAPSSPPAQSASHTEPSADGMTSTLLTQARQHSPDAWVRLVKLYYPLVQTWARRAGLQPSDAADLAQEVFSAVANGLDRFERKGGSFRGWLWGITSRQLLAHWRRRQQQGVGVGGTTAQERLASIANDDSESISRIEDRTDLLRRALDLLRDGVEEKTWQAFWRTAIDGQTAAEAAQALGLTVTAVYLAKARLLRRLREDFGGLLT